MSFPGQHIDPISPLDKKAQQRIPSISFVRGASAIGDIGEAFAINPVTGTGAMTAPIAAIPGVSVSAGVFPWPRSPARPTNGLPLCQDGQDAVQDTGVIVQSGAEEPLPLLEQDGNGKWTVKAVQRTIEGTISPIGQYRPCIEGLITGIEPWINRPATEGTPDVFHRSISWDNTADEERRRLRGAQGGDSPAGGVCCRAALRRRSDPIVVM